MPSASQIASKTDLGIDRASNTIRLTRNFDAPGAEIFAAWTKPEHVACWWDAAGERLAVCEIDLTPGGAFKFVTRGHPEWPSPASIARSLRPIGSFSRLLGQPDGFCFGRLTARLT
jgi:hypothetical protein